MSGECFERCLCDPTSAPQQSVLPLWTRLVSVLNLGRERGRFVEGIPKYSKIMEQMCEEPSEKHGKEKVHLYFFWILWLPLQCSWVLFSSFFIVWGVETYFCKNENRFSPNYTSPRMGSYRKNIEYHETCDKNHRVWQYEVNHGLGSDSTCSSWITKKQTGINLTQKYFASMTAKLHLAVSNTIHYFRTFI